MTHKTAIWLILFLCMISFAHASCYDGSCINGLTAFTNGGQNTGWAISYINDGSFDSGYYQVGTSGLDDWEMGLYNATGFKANSIKTWAYADAGFDLIDFTIDGSNSASCYDGTTGYTGNTLLSVTGNNDANFTGNWTNDVAYLCYRINVTDQESTGKNAHREIALYYDAPVGSSPTPPTINYVNISQTTANTQTDLVGVSNVSGSGDLNSWFIIYNGSTPLFSGGGYETYKEKNQEASCSGDCGNANDENWTTGINADDDKHYVIYENTSFEFASSQITNLIWEIKYYNELEHATARGVNVSFWDYDNSEWDTLCYNGLAGCDTSTTYPSTKTINRTLPPDKYSRNGTEFLRTKTDVWIEDCSLCYPQIYYEGSAFYSYNLTQQTDVLEDIINLSSIYTAKGESWTFSFLSGNGTNSSWYNTSTISIGDISPTSTNASISPSIAYYNTNMSLSCGGYDADGDNLNISYGVFKNGVLQSSGSLLNRASGIYQVYNLTDDIGFKHFEYIPTASQDYNFFDGNPLTSQNLPTSYVYANYTIHQNASTSRVYFYDYIGPHSLNMQNLCTNEPIYQMRLKYDLPLDEDTWVDCWNGSEWRTSKDYSTSGINTSHIAVAYEIDGNFSNGDIWDLQCNISNSGGEALLNDTITISDTKPTISSFSILPSTPNITSNLTTSIKFYDVDGDFIETASFLWYKNQADINMSNETTINSGNLSISDTWLVSGNIYAGSFWSQYLNSSSVLISGASSPSLSGDRLSATSGINNAPFDIFVNASDDGVLSFVKVQVTDTNSVATNFTMLINNGTEYKKTYTPSVDGSYSFKFFAQDTDLNLVTLESSLVYVDSTNISETGGGGGGGGSANDCGFEITKPSTTTKQASNKFCPTNSATAPFTFSVYNTQGVQQPFTFSVDDTSCTLSPSSAVADGNDYVSFQLQDCLCPSESGDRKEIEVQIKQGTCSQNIDVTLVGSKYLGYILQNWLLSGFIIVIMLLILVSIPIGWTLIKRYA